MSKRLKSSSRGKSTRKSKRASPRNSKQGAAGSGPGAASGSGSVVPSDLLDAVFGALAHPARRQILVSLYARGGEMTAGEIADRFKHSWPTTTRHLGVLERAGVVEVGKRGRRRFYKLRPERLVHAGGWIGSWAAESIETAEGKRPAWTELPYATMRNATPPGERPPKSGKGAP